MRNQIVLVKLILRCRSILEGPAEMLASPNAGISSRWDFILRGGRMC